MPTLGHICFGTRARAAKCWNLGTIFTPKIRSQFSIIQKRKLEKRFELWRQFAPDGAILQNLPTAVWQKIKTIIYFSEEDGFRFQFIWFNSFFINSQRIVVCYAQFFWFFLAHEDGRSWKKMMQTFYSHSCVGVLAKILFIADNDPLTLYTKNDFDQITNIWINQCLS